MNKYRILGIVILVIGIVLIYTVNNDLASFIAGILIGIGGVIAIAGKKVFSKKVWQTTSKKFIPKFDFIKL